MLAGFAKTKITPPVGTRMEGFGALQRDPAGAADIHDDLFARALYCGEGDETVLILAYDLLFFSRENADRLKAAVGRALDLSPRQILINTSHTHCGPHTSNYATHASLPPDRPWLEVVERQSIAAASEARTTTQPVTLYAATGRCRLPVSRRRLVEGEGVRWLPWPEGPTCDLLPTCLFRGPDDEPVCLLFSVSCHPSTVHVNQFSAEYPGAACRRLDAQLGGEVSMFLQGAGGDAKPCVVADGPAKPLPTWRRGGWEDIEAAGQIVAEDVLGLLDRLQPVAPAVASALVEAELPLQSLPDRDEIESFLEADSPARRHWAGQQLERLRRGFALEPSARVLVQSLTLGDGLTLAALEGEPVGELGLRIAQRLPGGTTFPLGYSNGAGLYLPMSRMLAEGGYEVESYFEYGYAAPLADGIEARLDSALDACLRLMSSGACQ